MTAAFITGLLAGAASMLLFLGVPSTWRWLRGRG